MNSYCIEFGEHEQEDEFGHWFDPSVFLVQIHADLSPVCKRTPTGLCTRIPELHEFGILSSNHRAEFMQKGAGINSM